LHTHHTTPHPNQLPHHQSLIAPAVARQAKQLGRKLKLQQKEDEEGGSEDEPGAGDKLWGASKKAYYADGDEYEVGG
jgi:hypothetical protein